MKRVLTALFLLTATCCHAQDAYQQLEEREQRIFKGAVVLGANISQLDGDTYSGYHKIGIHAGAAVSIRLGKKFNVSTELLYAQKGVRGGQLTESIYTGTYFRAYYLDLSYIELPLVLQYKHNLLWGFEAGLCYGRLLAAKEEGWNPGLVYIQPEYNYFNNTEISYILGGYFHCNHHWVANVRYQYSAIPVRPWQRVPLEYNMSTGQFSNVISLRMLYQF